ncbi:TonB-dependent receptor [Corticibacter populi]|uniref:TonB-dependent receptor n=1 Tax=Corticibacter populi TaxID=1550736 RepID=A0A3M6QPK2_9BURK|nr:TonB-dependent receptor [Corticibacter populi]
MAAAAAQPLAEVPMLGEVAVTATRQNDSVWEAPASVQVLGGEAFANGLGVNLSEGLGRVPGLQVQNRQNHAQDLQIIMRGFGARSTFGVRGIRIYVDGIPATMPDGQSQTSNIDLASLGRVEALNGPFSALYGNASGGVLQMETEQGHQPATLSVSTTFGSDGARRLGLKAQGARDVVQGVQDYVLSATRFETDGYRRHSQAERGIANARLGIGLADGSTLKLVANHVDISAQDPLGLSRGQMEADPRSVAAVAEQFDTRKTVHQSQAGLVWDKRLDADNQLRAVVYLGDRKTRQYQAIPLAPQQNNAGHAGGVIDLGRRYGGAELRLTSAQQWAGRDVLLVAGLAYDRLREDRRGYGNYRQSGGDTVYGVLGGLRRNERNTVWNLDPYVQASLLLAPRWTLDAGLRHSHVRFDSRDHYLANGDDSGSARYRAWLPSAALRWQASEALNVYVSAGRGFETPTVTELSYRADQTQGLNLDLQPARSTNWEVGAKWRAASGGLATAALFRTDTEDEIVSAGSRNGRSSFRNAGKTRRSGLELAWSQPLATHARLDLAYTWLKAQYRTAAAGDPWQVGNRLPGVPRQSAYAALGWAPPQGWQAGIELRHQGDIQVDDVNSDAAAAYTVLGASAGYVWRMGVWEWRAFARLDNALDKRYAGSIIVNDGNGRFFEPAPGRNWSAGVTASWAF